MTSKPAAAQPAARADWEAVEKEYRAGILTIREIGRRHGVSDAAVRKHANKKGWTRDLNEKIKARAQDLVNRQAVIDAQKLDYVSPTARVEDVRQHEIIEVAARNVAVVSIRQREETDRLVQLTRKMMAELEQYGDEGKAVLAKAVDSLAKKGDMDAATLRKIKGILSLGSRVEILKKLGETMRIATTMEREAYGMHAIPLGPDGEPLGRTDEDDARDKPIQVTIQVVDSSIPEPD